MKIEAIQSVTHQIKSYASSFTMYQEPLSEDQVLELQEKLLTNGFQFIKVPSFVHGRSLLYTFLRSILLYHEIGCLTDEAVPLESFIADIRHELVTGGYLDLSSSLYLEEYFVDYFYFDFMWIEASESLMKTSWFDDFERKLRDFGIPYHIPIVVLIA